MISQRSRGSDSLLTPAAALLCLHLRMKQMEQKNEPPETTLLCLLWAVQVSPILASFCLSFLILLNCLISFSELCTCRETGDICSVSLSQPSKKKADGALTSNHSLIRVSQPYVVVGVCNISVFLPWSIRLECNLEWKPSKPRETWSSRMLGWLTCCHRLTSKERLNKLNSVYTLFY